jgi:carbonic anhydrase
MTIDLKNPALHKLRIWASKTWQTNFKKSATNQVSIEWEAYFGSYCRCRDSLTWHKPDGTIDLEKSEKNNLNVQQAASSSLCQNPHTGYVLCIDEGVQDLHTNPKIVPICIPGCGILMQEKRAELIENIVKTTKSLGLKKLVVTSHADCGAARLAANHEFKAVKEKYSQAFFCNVAEILAEDYAICMKEAIKKSLGKNSDVEVVANHIIKLGRPKFHHAFGSIVSFEPRLNIGLFESKLGVPMFGVSASVLDNETTLKDTILSFKIASGADGFENYFNFKNPFEILAVVSNTADEERAKQIFKDVPLDLPLRYSLVSV